MPPVFWNNKQDKRSPVRQAAGLPLCENAYVQTKTEPRNEPVPWDRFRLPISLNFWCPGLLSYKKKKKKIQNFLRNNYSSIKS